MRSRLLEVPGFPEQINQETIPALVNTTDVGYPQDVPCLSWWKNQYKDNPWTSMIFSNFVMINGAGSRVYGISGCQCVEAMKHNHPFKFAKRSFERGIELYKKSRSLEKLKNLNESQKKGLNDIYAEMQHRELAGRICGNDGRLLTGRFLTGHGARDWDSVRRQLMPPKPGQNEKDPLGRRLRVAAVRALGEFLVDTRPFSQSAAEHLEALYIQAGPNQFHDFRRKFLEETGKKEVSPEDVPVPISLVKRAAHSLGLIGGQNWKNDDPKLLVKARAWWLQHQDEDRFRINVKGKGKEARED